MNWKLASVVLLAILIVPTIGFVYEYAQNQQLESEIVKTNVELNELRGNVTALQSQVAHLRERLRISNYTIIGLTFVWSPILVVDMVAVSKAVESMNDEFWDQFHIYFFIYHASPQYFSPLTVQYDRSQEGEYNSQTCFSIGWCGKAWNLYPERDIPIGIFSNIGRVAGWEIGNTTCNVVAISTEYFGDPAIVGRILEHELLHVLGFSDQDLGGGPHFPLLPLGFPTDWLQRWSSRIQSSAKWFQMSMPDDIAA